MSAMLRDGRLLLPMSVAQLDAVMDIEEVAYPVPWTRGNFVDSMSAPYVSRLLYGPRGELLGYFVAMEGVEEMHLLNLAVVPWAQRRGHAWFMLDEVVALGKGVGARQLWLEVRVSNVRALMLYQRFGFLSLGIRRGYYPSTSSSRQSPREDAQIMNLSF